MSDITLKRSCDLRLNISTAAGLFVGVICYRYLSLSVKQKRKKNKKTIDFKSTDSPYSRIWSGICDGGVDCGIG